MNILLRQTIIIDRSSPFHLKKADVLISDGVISRIADNISEKADQTISLPGLHISRGWVDIFSNFCDPGFEFKETVETGARAAAAGGFTDVFLIPNTAPVVHSKAGVEYLVQKNHQLPVTIHPVGAVTKNAEGKELSEMYDMHASGAKVFSDGMNSIQSPGLLIKALQYLRAIDATIIQLPDDRSINPGGLMNEGIISTRLGLPGRAVIAEELMIARDIELMKYAGGKLHITGVSSKKSIELISSAKKDGINITCSVTPNHLLFCDEDLAGYDTNLKLNPPLRTREDMMALREAVINGDIDCIATHHFPEDVDHKMTEFEYARYGTIGLQTAFGAVQEVTGLSADKLVQLFANNPRRIFSLDTATIEEGNAVSLTLFQPGEKWQFGRQQNLSRSANSPFFGKTFSTRVAGIINKGNLFLND